MSESDGREMSSEQGIKSDGGVIGPRGRNVCPSTIPASERSFQGTYRTYLESSEQLEMDDFPNISVRSALTFFPSIVPALNGAHHKYRQTSSAVASRHHLSIPRYSTTLSR